jgi:tetratricopeptide (TPR) repeat protein
MHRLAIPLVLVPALLAGCATNRPKATSGTLADLRKVSPDLQEATIDQGLDQAIQGYRRFLAEAPQTAMTPEAMRRLADLEIEKQFGVRGDDQKPQEMAAPEPAQVAERAAAATPRPDTAVAAARTRESEQAFEQRATAESALPANGAAGATPAHALPVDAHAAGALEAIGLYERLLKEYPAYEHNDEVLYQMARAYAELGRTDEAMQTMERLIKANPQSVHFDEAEFRRGEYLFTRRKYHEAESAYSSIIDLGSGSSYYELALYKLGWTLYKEEDYEEALHRYIALLDYKVQTGYDFDGKHEEDDERRVADTFRVISLSFSNLGGSDAVREYFTSFGNRPYEERVYSNLGDHYLEKLRYDDAAKTFKAFVTLYPFHRAAPQFSMRVIDTFTQGGFPKLVLESKREFASRYGLQSEYWQHFKPEESPDVLAYLKENLKDLATHYHAEYQNAEKADEKPANYREALQWYGKYLESFPTDTDAPSMNYRYADLLLEHEDFGEAAKQYEHTAYGYPPHDQSAAAGYAAIYAYREQLKAAGADAQDAVKHDVVASSLKFADSFPQDEHAAPVLGAAADDLYEMKDYQTAIETAQRLIDGYAGADPAIRRSAWLIVAHGSFELSKYPEAEHAYTEVLADMPQDDASRSGLVDNLAASIYKQGEQANQAQDYRAAADHFLRIRTVAPTSSICATAEYDAGAALVRLQDWKAAAEVLETFRTTYPTNDMVLEATRQIAHAYREDGQLPASDSQDETVRRDSLLVAGDLYEQSKAGDRALSVYQHYVDEFPKPVEPALEARFRIAEIHRTANETPQYLQELSEIVRIDAAAGPDRTARTRTLGGRSALVLAEQVYRDFTTVKLRQPFETSLQDKKQRMDTTIEAMDALVGYEIADVTAAATYYMAETYLDFSRSLIESERPDNLAPSELQEYDRTLEETAAPFKEKAIGLDEKNLEMLRAGVSNEWIEKSLGRLAELLPERYARGEISAGFMDSIDSYVYRLPVQPTPAPAPGAGEATPAAGDATSGAQTAPAAPPPAPSTGQGGTQHADSE